MGIVLLVSLAPVLAYELVVVTAVEVSASTSIQVQSQDDYFTIKS